MGAIIVEREYGEAVPITADAVVVKQHNAGARPADELVLVTTNERVVVNFQRPTAARAPGAFGAVVRDESVVNLIVSNYEPCASVSVSDSGLPGIIVENIVLDKKKLR